MEEIKKNKISKNKAFTIAELLITLAIIGLVAAIIIPVAVDSVPNSDAMKFKKGNSTLYSVISRLLKEDKYFHNGDFGIGTDGNLITSPTYFCESFADVTKAKSTNCQETGGTLDASALLLMASSGEDKIKGTDIEIYDVIDCICKNNKPASSEVFLFEGISYYLVNSLIHFGSVDSFDNRIFSPNTTDKRYKYLCMQIDGSTEDPFGYAIRQDGKIIPGTRAQKWNDKKLQKDTTIIPQANTSVCSSLTLGAFSNEFEIDCGEDHIKQLDGRCKYSPGVGSNSSDPYSWCKPSNGLVKIIADLDGDGTSSNYCVTQRNIGDGAVGSGYNGTDLPSSIAKLTAGDSSSTCSDTDSSGSGCCWTGNTARSDNCDSVNGSYSGCNRTVCNWWAATTICPSLTIQGQTDWRLPTSTELTNLNPATYSKSTSEDYAGDEGLMLCDNKNGYSSSECMNNTSCYGTSVGGNYCFPHGVWTSITNGTTAYFGSLDLGIYTSNSGSYMVKSTPFSVRCIKKLD